jgi:rod shape-determining protein MreB and related proteins
VQNLAYSYSRREHSRIATRYYVVAQLEVGMAWHLFQICQFRNSPLPSQIAEIASALTDLGDEAPEDFIVHGPNRITALPMEVPVCYQEIAHCLDKTVAKIENAVLSALENTPPELYADIVKNGIWLSGGGALLRGLDKRLQDKINIPFHIAEDPLHSVAKGAGIALKNVDRFSFLMR